MLVGRERELRAHDADGVEHVGEGLVRIRDAEALHVGCAPDRPVDHRPDALDEIDLDPHAEDGGHDVG